MGINQATVMAIVVYGATIVVAFWLLWLLDRKAKRDQFIDNSRKGSNVPPWPTPERVLPASWPAFAPDHGERFEYEGHVFAVVGVYDCSDPRGSPGIVCHFADSHGVVWEARFSAYQWDALSNYRNWLPRINTDTTYPDG